MKNIANQEDGVEVEREIPINIEEQMKDKINMINNKNLINMIIKIVIDLINMIKKNITDLKNIIDLIEIIERMTTKMKNNNQNKTAKMKRKEKFWKQNKDFQIDNKIKTIDNSHDFYSKIFVLIFVYFGIFFINLNILFTKYMASLKIVCSVTFSFMPAIFLNKL